MCSSDLGKRDFDPYTCLELADVSGNIRTGALPAGVEYRRRDHCAESRKSVSGSVSHDRQHEIVCSADLFFYDRLA